MSLDTKIAQALGEAAAGMRARPGAWPVVRSRIQRSRRRRRVVSASAAATMLAIAALSYSLLDGRPSPVTAEGPGTISPRSGAFRLSFPEGWGARANDDLSVTITPRGANTGFMISAQLRSGEYDKPGMDPWFLFSPARSRIDGGRTAEPSNVHVAGRPAVRWEVGPYDASAPQTASPSPHLSEFDRLVYLVDWPPSAPQCAPAGPCTLALDLQANSVEIMQRYLAAGERIALSAEVVPAEQLPPVRGVQAKVPLKAGPMATGAELAWALEFPDFDYNLDRLYRIDPRTNAITGNVEVGYLPSAVAANDDGVWVANRRACDVIADCADSQFPGSTDLDGFPAQSSVRRFDPRSLQVVANISVRNPEAIALAQDSVWVVDTSSNGGSSLVRIDSQTNTITARIPISGQNFAVQSLVVMNDSVWVAVGGKLHRVDPRTNAISRSFDVVGELIAPQPSGGSVWLAGGDGTTSEILEFDPRAGRVVGRFRLSRQYRWTAAERSIWSVGSAGSLRRFDIQTGSADEPMYLPGGAGVYGLTTGFGSVWVAADDGTIWRVAD